MPCEMMARDLMDAGYNIANADVPLANVGINADYPSVRDFVILDGTTVMGIATSSRLNEIWRENPFAREEMMGNLIDRDTAICRPDDARENVARVFAHSNARSVVVIDADAIVHGVIKRRDILQPVE